MSGIIGVRRSRACPKSKKRKTIVQEKIPQGHIPLPSSRSMHRETDHTVNEHTKTNTEIVSGCSHPNLQSKENTVALTNMNDGAISGDMNDRAIPGDMNAENTPSIYIFIIFLFTTQL